MKPTFFFFFPPEELLVLIFSIQFFFFFFLSIQVQNLNLKIFKESIFTVRWWGAVIDKVKKKKGLLAVIL